MPEAALLERIRPAADPVLRPVEKRLLLHLAHGVPRKEIHETVGLTVRTAEGFLATLYSKLGVGFATHAVIAGHQYGLLPREVFSTPELDGEESDLLQLIGAGLMNREIAAKYDMPMWVVAARVSALYGAMDVLNRPNCAHVAWCTGLLGADS